MTGPYSTKPHTQQQSLLSVVEQSVTANILLTLVEDPFTFAEKFETGRSIPTYTKSTRRVKA